MFFNYLFNNLEELQIILYSLYIQDVQLFICAMIKTLIKNPGLRKSDEFKQSAINIIHIFSPKITGKIEDWKKMFSVLNYKNKTHYTVNEYINLRNQEYNFIEKLNFEDYHDMERLLMLYNYLQTKNDIFTDCEITID